MIHTGELNYFTIFDTFIDFTSPTFINANNKILSHRNYGNELNSANYSVPRTLKQFSSDGIILESLSLDFKEPFNEFTFFLTFHHKKDQELTINFCSENPNPLTPIAFRLRIDNSKIYFEPLHGALIPTSPADTSGKIKITLQKNLSEDLHFDPPYIGKHFMLWFTYNLTYRVKVDLNNCKSKLITIKGLIKMKLNNDDRELDYNINITLYSVMMNL